LASQINASNSGFGGIVSTGDSSGQLQLQTAGTTAITIDTSQRAAFVAGTAALPAITTTGDTNTGMWFPAADTIAFAEGGTESMRIDSSGNVGIGTASPLQKLDMNGTTARFSNGSYTGYLGAGSLLVSGAASDFTLRSDNVLSFGTGGPYERMRIASDGKVMFNTSSALNAGYMSLLFDGSAINGFTIKNSSATFGPYLYFVNSAGNVAGYVIQNGTTTVSYTTSSDYRLKENIVPMTGALDKVLQLKPVNYTWKQDGSDGQGFIAHELQEVVPDCVTGEKDAVDEEGNIKPQGIDTSFLVATLTAAIQEMKAIIDAQSVTINALKARIETLEAK
jgi:hypothetical protein